MERTIDKETVLMFIKAYYTSFAHDPQSLVKFYDPESYVYRPGMEGSVGIKFEDAKEQIVNYTKLGSTVNVKNYQILPIADKTNVIVNGTIEYEGQITSFTQFFTIGFRNQAVWILSDSITDFNASLSEEELTKDLVEPQRNERHH
ncbi:hypothetical protein TVAG_249360 [Trichomonas vaginalis G3]|uniref:NTF2 domain-containing protein n=1 Tax=Trichomonas vaginalis (strain ATCC PRA-98 / G3) TaxID=412133 RepID=A2DCD9_TRIV3|nr:NTF2-like family [Trichomonas vaginalis G3]EAY21876.1 hypothetical protein TVAG_249360 [Trichomonas vaginalis G3]KAI5487650.1 NTF2-like family [Trichomonas vaginalis G3]|eukprot:XP_001582862.1 hypothetical protein [Trichomonas vaginalis G3]